MQHLLGARNCLQVLQLFLETFSKFDWEQYAVSIRGPVRWAAAAAAA